jgi:hypothetical protein
MPRRNDLHRILIIGSGPIVIGQACEFDYSGTQAAKALRSDGYEVVLVNSNPATIMTDPDLADRTYVEPLTLPYLEEIIRKERPDALLSTVGGQTGLNLSMELAEAGVLDRYSVELIGAKIDAIKKAEDRLLFKDAMRKIGLETPHSKLVKSEAEALAFAERIGYPCILRPSFTLGGTGGGIAYNREDLTEIIERGLALSPGARGADRRKRARLEGIRAGGDARPGRQRHHRLLHREFRSHGRAHRRFHHGGAGPDPHRPRIPDDARWRDSLPARDRRGYGGSNVQFAIDPDRAHGDHRDEPARFAQLGAGVQSHRIPDCQDRRQARGGLPAGRDPQRHHAQDAGLLRADHRLRGGQDSQVAVRKIPRRRSHAGHADEVGGRGDGHRAHLQTGHVERGCAAWKPARHSARRSSTRA